MAPIVPLPVFEADADPRHRDALTDAEVYARLEAPKSIVVRFGRMKLVGEYVYGGDAKPGCGSKLVARTHRGTELVEMLTTTCENAGCSKSISRRELLKYVENSGGKEFPFYTNGRVIRVATIEDLNRHSAMEAERAQAVRRCRALVAEMGLPMKVVDAEPILGGELLTFYYTSEERIDFRDLVKALAAEFPTRIDMRQVGARDEARLVADYERCGQYCCCKNFLKVLKPISMTAAKMQKATLDPLKISGRCGRLMCCLRYEDQTYRELKARLPHRKSRVGTSEGPGIVVDSKILVQLVLVRLDHDEREIAVPVEELMDPETCPRPGERVAEPVVDPLRGLDAETARRRADKGEAPPERRRRRRGRRDEERAPTDAADAAAASADRAAGPDAARGSAAGAPAGEPGAGTARGAGRRRRRRGRRGGAGASEGGAARGPAERPASPAGDAAPTGGAGTGEAVAGDGGGGGRRRRRRGGRGRRRGGDGGRGGGDSSGGPASD